MGTEIHALALTTLTPEEWENLRAELESRGRG
jgi:acid stress-induced BolA-like protein IbaG/YrbA